MATATKWFYKLQEEANEQIKAKYETLGFCNFQDITKDRVFEGWTVKRIADEKVMNIIVVMFKQIENVFIYENN